MLQGLLVSSVFACLIYLSLFLGYPFSNELTKEYLLILFLPILLIGSILGFVGKTLYENRFKKLFLIGIFLVYLVSLFYAGAMVLNDTSNLLQGNEKVIAILKLGSTGFLLFGVVVLPILALGVFIIELWTHPKM